MSDEWKDYVGAPAGYAVPPMGPTVEVTTRWRDGTEHTGTVDRFWWHHDGEDDDIVAWRFAPKPKADNATDTVNHPSHYNQGSIECIDAMEEATKNLKGAEAVCTSNIIRYTWRWKDKNGIEDLKKARWYLDRLIAKVEKDA